MEPKALRTPSALEAAALRAAVAGTTPETAPKLTKPVRDVDGFRSTSWTTAASAAPTPDPSGPRVVAPIEALPPAPLPALPAISSLRDDVADLRRTVAAVSESLRLLEAKLAAVQTPSGRG